MKMQILCTLGPSSMNDRVIARLEELEVSLFRLNLSHISADDAGRMIEYLQSRSSVPICLDTEGAQIRTGYLVEPQIVLRENSTVRVPRYPVPGDAMSFNLYPSSVLDAFQVGDFITIDTVVLAQVIDVEKDGLVLRVLTGGPIGRNKAATLERDVMMPPLTGKDLEALAIGRDMGVKHVALSFTHTADDIDEIRAASAPDAFVIAKIECLTALANLGEIVKKADALLIDRGDLSRQVPLEKIPLVQKAIISAAKNAGVPCYVATNLMESMITEPTPTRAEVNDVFNTMIDGADGLVLAAETAIGAYPIEAVSMVKKLISEFEGSLGTDPLRNASQPVSLLNEPHGGELVRREVTQDERAEIARLPSLVLGRLELNSAEQIATGGFSPLTGFMDRDTLMSVVENYRLPSGLAWPMPITLRVTEDEARRLTPSQRVLLKSESGHAHSILDVREVYEIDLRDRADALFGEAVRHVRISRLLHPGGVLVAGKVTLVDRLPLHDVQYQLTPDQTRYLFTKKGWNRIISFHTHSLPHRVHEEIHHKALAQTHADGLYISTETGAVEPGDFRPDQILRAYQTMLDFGLYPRGQVVLGAASTFSRGGSARAAVFQAICAKNLGFSHIVVGRADRTGRGPRALFERMGNLGIEPVFFDTLGYDPVERSYVSGRPEAVTPISGRALGDAVRAGERLPEWYVRSILQDSLRAELAAGRPVFLP